VTAIAVAQPRSTVSGRLTAQLLLAGAWVLRHLPDRFLHRLTQWVGASVLYRLQPGRRRLVKSNLRRVVDYLGRPEATDERALNRLVQQAFGHYVRSYVEGAIVPAYDGPHIAQRVQPDDPVLAQKVFSTGPLIIVSMHFGALELGALWAVRVRGLRVTSPMETIENPDLQRYFEQTRSRAGLRVIPTQGAARVLTERLAAGEAVGVVADRVVAGTGARVELFGAPARLPLGPAVLALESGAPAWAVATRRAGFGDYRGSLERIDLPTEGTRKERLAGFMANQARAVERLIAAAPEQWWSVFFPIWEDAA
jgi:KDO2-lipid IV(A) lauroyltransferase